MTYRFVDVDVALVLDSACPLALDLIADNPDLTFGIIQIGEPGPLPGNVQWVRTVPLRDDSMRFRPSALNMRADHRAALSHQLFDALTAVAAGSFGPMWRLHDEAMRESTRHYPLWALLGSREFLQVVTERVADLSLAEAFRQISEFFTISYALLGTEMPKASVYHAHSSGYAAVLSAAAARTHGGRFLLTSHTPPPDDTPWRLLCNASADHITYLYESDEPVVTIPRERVWRLACVTEVAPFLDAARELVSRGITNWTLDVFGPISPTEGLTRHITFRETADVRALLADFDLLLTEPTADALQKALTELARSEPAEPDFFQSQKALALYSQIYRQSAGNRDSARRHGNAASRFR